MNTSETLKSWGQRKRKSCFASLLLAATFVLGACGGSTSTDAEASLEASAAETTAPMGQEATPEPLAGDAGWVSEVAALTAGLSPSDAGLEERLDLLTETRAVDQLQQQLRDSAEHASLIRAEFPPGSPAEYELTYEAFLTALEDWSNEVDSALKSIDERSRELQDELNLMGDDIGQIMEGSEASELVRRVFAAREAATNACFDLQAATQSVEPVIACTDVTPVPEQVGDRIKIETTPPFTMVVDDPDSVLLEPDGVNVGGNGNFVIFSSVELSDPAAAYSEMSINPIVPPDDLQDWIDATTVISVVDQGTTAIGGYDSRWWTITGSPEGLKSAGADFVGLLSYGEREYPQQINSGDMITIWEIPHPESFVYVIVNNPRELFRDQVLAVLATIEFDV